MLPTDGEAVQAPISPGTQAASFAERIIDRHAQFGDYDVFYRHLVFLDKRERQVMTQTVLRQTMQHYHIEQRAYYNRYFHSENRVIENRFFRTENHIFVNRHFHLGSRLMENRLFNTEGSRAIDRRIFREGDPAYEPHETSIPE